MVCLAATVLLGACVAVLPGTDFREGDYYGHPAVVRTAEVARSSLFVERGDDGLRLQLFSDVGFDIAITAETLREDGIRRIQGRSRADMMASADIVVSTSGLMGAVRTDRRIYEIVSISPQNVRVIEIDIARIGPDDRTDPLPDHTEMSKNEARSTPIQQESAVVAAASSGEDTIDILLVFPSHVMSRRGYALPYRPYCTPSKGFSRLMRSMFSARTNWSLNDALNNASRVKVIGAICVEHVSACTGDEQCIDRELDWLSSRCDGFENSYVNGRRNHHSADVVAMITKDTVWAGYSFVLPEDANSVTTDYSAYGFLVVVDTWAFSNYSFAHELGHVLGLRHDRPSYHSSATPTSVACADGGWAARCNYGSAVMYMGLPVGHSIMASSWTICPCYPGAPSECAVRYPVFSTPPGSGPPIPDDPETVGIVESDFVFGATCVEGSTSAAHDENLFGRHYLRRNHYVVSRYRPANPALTPQPLPLCN